MRTSSEKQQVQPPLDVPGTIPYDEKANGPMLDDSRDTSRDKLERIDNALGEDEGSLGSSEDDKPAIQIPWKYRLAAIVLIILFGTGNTYASFVMGPLKTRLTRELKISNAQFSVITSASSLINTLLPMIGGSIVDRYGGSRVALVSSILCVIGAVVGSCSSFNNKYTVLVAGEIILGFGSAIQDICQYKLYPHWFAGSHMGLIFGVNVAWSRILQLIGRLTAVPLAKIGLPGREDYWGWALWIPTITTFLSGFCVYAYYYFENKILPEVYRPAKPAIRNDKTLLQDWADTFRSIFTLPKMMWIINCTQLLQGGAARVWLRNAGYDAALQGVIPIVLTPAVGYFFDRIGWRMVFVTTTSLIWILVWALAGFTKVNMLAPVLISSFAAEGPAMLAVPKTSRISAGCPFVIHYNHKAVVPILAMSAPGWCFAYVTNLIPFMATVPILLPNGDSMGSAFGVWQSFQNAGTIIMDVASGAIQDRTPGKQYDRVFIFIMTLKAYDAFLGPFYDWLDGRWLGHQLRMPERKRRDKLVQEQLAGREYEGHKCSKFWVITGCSILSASIVTAWALYIIYSMK